MKKTLASVVLAAASLAAFAQGKVTLCNDSSSLYTLFCPSGGPYPCGSPIPITGPLASGVVFEVGLYGGTNSNALTLQTEVPLNPSGGGAGPNAGQPPFTHVVCSFPGGSLAYFQVFVWDSKYSSPQLAEAASSYEGQNNIFSMTPGTSLSYPLITSGGSSTWTAVGDETPFQVYGTPDEGPMVFGLDYPSVVHAHDTALLSVGVTGRQPFTYQWSFNGAAIPGATSDELSIPDVTPEKLGYYAVWVTDVYGAGAGAETVLSMFPYIATPFPGAVTYWGKTATFRVEAWGSGPFAGPLAYQWFQNGAAIHNATNQSLTFSSIQFSNAGLYTVVVTNLYGSATNAPAEVVVEPAELALSLSGVYPALTIDGVGGYSYIIQGAPKLTDTNAWITLTNLTLGSSQPIQVWVDTNVDASSPLNPEHFYRVLPGQ